MVEGGRKKKRVEEREKKNEERKRKAEEKAREKELKQLERQQKKRGNSISVHRGFAGDPLRIGRNLVGR